MKRVPLLSAIFIAILIGKTPAQASVAELTFTGVINFGTDGGIFGPVLPNDPYSVQYLFNTDLGFHTSTEIVGGGSSGFPTPSLGATVTINGHTFTIAGATLGDLVVGSIDSAGRTGAGAFVNDSYSLGSAQIGQSFSTFSGPFSLTTPFTYVLTPDDAGSGTLRVQNFGWSASIPIQTTPGFMDDIEFRVQTVSFSVSAVPELSTWALMLVGFAGLGFLNYRRSRAIVAS